MKFFVVLMTLFTVFGVGHALAEGGTNLCVEMDLKAEPVGTVCVSNVGARFQRYEDPVTKELGIADLARRVVWFDRIVIGAPQEAAFVACANGKGRGTPFIKTFRESESHGFREAFRDDMKGLRIWSANYQSHYPDEYGWYYNGNNGDTGIMWSWMRGSGVGIRCVRDI